MMKILAVCLSFAAAVVAVASYNVDIRNLDYGSEEDDTDVSLAAILNSLPDTESDETDSNDGNGDGNGGNDDLRAILNAYRQLNINMRDSVDEGGNEGGEEGGNEGGEEGGNEGGDDTDDDALTDEDAVILKAVAELDDDTIQDLIDNRELLAYDDEITSRSLKAQMAQDALFRRLLNDHPDLRELAYGVDDAEEDVISGAFVDKRGWPKKRFFKKIGSSLKKLWMKWKSRVIAWLKTKGRALACRYCRSPGRISGMGWTVFRIIKGLIKAAACAICRAG